jgi:hypothetical protein
MTPEVALALSHRTLNDLLVPHILISVNHKGIRFLVSENAALVEIPGTAMWVLRKGIPVCVGGVPIHYTIPTGPTPELMKLMWKQAESLPDDVMKAPPEMAVLTHFTHFRQIPSPFLLLAEDDLPGIADPIVR